MINFIAATTLVLSTLSPASAPVPTDTIVTHPSVRVVTVDLPARSILTDQSACNYVAMSPRVTITGGRQLRPHWNRDHDVQNYGHGVWFDGMELQNGSSHRVTATLRLFDGCR